MTKFLPLAVLALFLSTSTALLPPTSPPASLPDVTNVKNMFTEILDMDLMKEFDEYIANLFDEIKDEYPEAAPAFKDLITSLSEAMLNPDGDSIAKITAAVQKLLKYPEALRKFLQGLLGKIFDKDSDLYKKFSAEINDIFDDFASNPKNIAKFATDLLSKITGLILTVSKGVIELKLEIIKQFAEGFMNLVKKINEGFKENFPKIFENFILPLLKYIFEVKSAIFQELLKDFQEVVTDLASSGANTGMDILKTILAIKKLIVNVVWGILKIKIDIFLAFTKAFKDILEAIAKNGANIAANFAKVIGEMIEKLLKTIFNVKSAIYQYFSEAFKQILDKIAGDVEHIPKYIPEFLAKFVELIKEVISGIIRAKLDVLEAFAQGFRDIFDGLYAQGGDLAGYVSEALAAFGDFLTKFFADFAASLGGADSAGFGAVVSLLGVIASLIVSAAAPGGGGIIIG